MKGTVSNILFQNKENFMICLIHSTDIPKEYRNEDDPYYCVVLGTMSVIPSLKYEFNGKWIKKEGYGWELKVSEYKEILPDKNDKYATIAYLQSGLFNGIGPEIAKRIVNCFGEDTLDVIQNDYERLAEVKGISKKKAQIIFDCYLQNKQYQEVMMLLKPYGISNKKIMKIVDKYGFDTINMLHKNPYKICKECQGFGFLTADAFAMASGISRRDKFRIKEGIKYCLDKSAQEKGNLYMTKKMLGTNLSKVLNSNLTEYIAKQFAKNNNRYPTQQELREELVNHFVNEEDVMLAIEELFEERIVKLEYEESKFIKKQVSIYDEDYKTVLCKGNFNETFKVVKYIDKSHLKIEYNGVQGYINPQNASAIQFDCYLSVYYNSELLCAKHINRLLYSRNTKTINVSLNDCISELETKNNIKYAPKQKEAIMSIFKRNFLIITGGPGTGKTTIINGILSTYRKFYPKDTIFLAAPTGRAAKRITETTNENALTIHRLLEYNPNEGFLRNEENPIDADMIIIDETSMVDILLFLALLRAIPTSCKLILVGDVDQLPSVGPGMVLKDVIESKKTHTIYLNEIFRQANTSKIVINAYKVNNHDTNLEYGSDFQYYRMEQNEYVDFKKAVVEKICELFQQKIINNNGNVNDVQVLVPFRAKHLIGVNELNKILAPIANPRPADEECIVFGDITYRINDKVMQMKNNYEKNVFNGDIGYIKKIFKDENGYKMLVDFGLPENVLFDEFDELTLAYASTIHKSQGSEYPSVIIPILKEQEFFLQKCILYTAMTRARSECTLLGEYQALMTAIGRNKIVDRKTKLTKRIDDFDAKKL